MDSDYRSLRHPKQDEIGIKTCYLCGKSLGGEKNPDHIIPDHLFSSGDPNRPQLNVHQRCNKQKSKDDEWFVKQLEFSTAYDPEAYLNFSRFLDKAQSEIPDAYLIGKKPRHLVMAKKIFEKGVWGMELVSRGQTYAQFKPPKENTERFYRFIENMCRGLFIRNVQASCPGKPELIIRQYEELKIKGKYEGFRESVQGFINSSQSSLFGQSWGNRTLYLGSRVVETPNKGFIFVEFYRQIGMLGFFK